MDAGNPVSVDLVVAQNVGADERQIQVAGAWTIGIEECAVLPSVSGDGATSQHDRFGFRHALPHNADEFLELLGIAAERKANHVTSLFVVGKLFRLLHGL